MVEIMVWGCIAFNEVGKLHFIDDILDVKGCLKALETQENDPKCSAVKEFRYGASGSGVQQKDAHDAAFSSVIMLNVAFYVIPPRIFQVYPLLSNPALHPKTGIMLYKLHIRSILIYASHSWLTTAPSHIQSLVRVQNRCLRLVLHVLCRTALAALKALSDRVDLQEFINKLNSFGKPSPLRTTLKTATTQTRSN
ncbi:hypothetical protein Trydic_g23699 [Trypoxylus dichotomus]